MPNHITNIVTFNGTPEQIKAVMECIVNEKEEITFNGFAPMPEELRGTTSPTRVVTAKELAKLKAEKKRDEKIVAEAIEKYGEDNLPDDIKRTRGMLEFRSLPITKRIQKDLIEKYGVDNWYEWAHNNWGTKWGAYDGRVLTDECVEFQTAWSTPFQAMIKLSEKFPEVEIVVDFADEDFSYNCGQYTIQGGEFTDEDVPEGGSKEAILKAIDVQYGSVVDYLDSNIEWMFESVETSEDLKNLDKYDKTLLEIVFEAKIEYGVYEDRDRVIAQYLMDKAIEVEDYEYAEKLKKELEKVEK